MFKSIIGTIGSKFLLALMSFLIVTLTSHNLGSEGFGYISLIILGITMVQMVNNFVGGPALVYLIPRYQFLKLFVPSYLWAFLSSLLVTLIMYTFHLIPRQFTLHILCISFIASVNSINQMVLLGKEKIKIYNLVTLCQLAFMLLSLSFFFLILKQTNIEAYIVSLYIQFGVGALTGYLFIRKEICSHSNLEGNGVLKEMFRYGSFTQTANILQFLNYRLGFYIIDFYEGKAVLGVFNVGVQIAEGLWLIGKSLALIQYSKISNSRDSLFAKTFSIQLLKISVLSTLILIGFVFILPDSFFTFIFGKDFYQVKELFIYLSPGVLSIAACLMFSHYFSGLGKIHVNTIASCIGLLFTFAAGFLLIPRFGLIGAALATSISYFSICAFQFFMFLKISKAKLSELLIKSTDIAFAKNKIKYFFDTLRKIR